MIAPDVSRAAIAQAHDLIAPYIRQTPVLELETGALSSDLPAVILKLECLQHSGSFKARGAFANILMRSIPEAGLAAASGGNHGVAVAYAARRLGLPARIFVPEISSKTKIERIRNLDAELVIKGERYADALAGCNAWLAANGAISIHAYDQTETLLGQGTLAREFDTQVPDLDTVLVAVGGGGLIGGMAAWFRGKVKLVGVEPSQSCALHTALVAGRPVDVDVAGIAADSLGARQVGALMFPLAQAYLDGVVLVTDDDIRAAQHRLWEMARIVAEPGGAAAIAALMSGAYKPQPGERVGVVVCGGNTDAVAFSNGA